MTQLEENNLKSQLEILNKNNSDKSMINYYVSKKASNIKTLIYPLKKVDEKVTMDAEIFYDLMDFLSNASEPSNWYKIDESARDYQIKVDARNEILGSLKKGN